MQKSTPSRVRFAAASVVVLGLLLTPFGVSAAVAADDTVGISGSPATADGSDGRSRFSYAADPGQHIDDFYEVRNTGTGEQTMTVLATDAYNTDDGGYGLLDTEATPTDAGSWVTVDGQRQVTLVLAAGETRVLPFSIDVPADAAPGDHAAGLLVSTVSPDGQVLVDRRVGTRMYLRVSGELQPLLAISSMAPSYEGGLNPLDGTATVTYTITNSGNIALSATAVTSVKTVFGLQIGDLVRTDIDEMLPGSTRTVTVEVGGVGQFGYLNPTVRMIGKADGFVEAPIKEVSRDAVLIAVPWSVLVVLVLGLGIWLFLKWRRKRDATNAAAWVAYTEAEALRKAAESAPEREPAGGAR
ncbi:hypothetical protein [Agromyces allii]|uniref:DUF916 domain-containing protein n=1 Tax=Agromyces allii TaxID=393607 RepID=A0ABP5C0S9_9MICO|nr:hypothetical protein [Agromyces allii]